MLGPRCGTRPAGPAPLLPQVLDLGHTQLPEDVREALLADLSERYTPGELACGSGERMSAELPAAAHLAKRVVYSCC